MYICAPVPLCVSVCLRNTIFSTMLWNRIQLWKFQNVCTFIVSIVIFIRTKIWGISTVEWVIYFWSTVSNILHKITLVYGANEVRIKSNFQKHSSELDYTGFHGRYHINTSRFAMFRSELFIANLSNAPAQSLQCFVVFMFNSFPYTFKCSSQAVLSWCLLLSRFVIFKSVIWKL